MTVRDLIETNVFQTLVEGTDLDAPVTGVFCCDLLSVAMGKGAERAAWVTVMGNVNTLAVLRLTDMSCVVLAEGARMDDACATKAKEEGVTVLSSPDPVFTCALKIHEMVKSDEAFL